MPAVSKKQQRYFGYLLSNPEERKKKGISKKAAKDFAQDVKEVAPPGWGHTKAEKEKTKPDKPKSKIGGSAAAFKRALDDGRFKGLPGDKTKKEKTASMFKLMWSMKKKGDKPHYKPGTDKKYKKYQEEVVYEGRVARAVRDTIDKLPKGRLGGKRERIRQAAVNAEIRDKKSTEKGTTYKQWSDAVNSARERTEKKRRMNEQDSGMLGPIPGIAKAISTGASVLRTLSLGGDTPQSKKLSPKPKPKVKLNKP